MVAGGRQTAELLPCGQSFALISASYSRLVVGGGHLFPELLPCGQSSALISASYSRLVVGGGFQFFEFLLIVVCFSSVFVKGSPMCDTMTTANFKKRIKLLSILVVTPPKEEEKGLY